MIMMKMARKMGSLRKLLSENLHNTTNSLACYDNDDDKNAWFTTVLGNQKWLFVPELLVYIQHTSHKCAARYIVQLYQLSSCLLCTNKTHTVIMRITICIVS